MMLRKASDSFTGSRRRYNPLWKHVYSSFLNLVVEPDVGEESTLYVERRQELGVDPSDISNYIRHSRRMAFLLVAPTGLGKTTFLRHVLAGQLATEEWWLVWVNVLGEVDEADERPPIHQVKELIRRKLENLITNRPRDLVDWYDFSLSRLGLCDGKTGVLLAEWRKNGTLSTQDQVGLAEMFERANVRVLDYTRAQCAFIRGRFRRIPGVIIDNVDHLATNQIHEILKYADLLARGAESPGAPTDDHAGVVVGLRPVSLSSPHTAARRALRGELRPPIIADVLERRLKDFLDNFRGRVGRGTFVSDASGSQIELREVLGEGFEDKPADVVIREILVQLTRATTNDSTRYRMSVIDLVHKLANCNTRLSLLATANYVASGHLNWKDLLDALAGRQNIRDVLTPRRTLKAILLGVNAIYDTRNSWLCNLFNDVVRDRIGVIVRLRVLMAIEHGDAESGMPIREVVVGLESLFDYPGSRIERTCSNLRELGLIEERKPEYYTLTPGGLLYLRTMLVDFEYLQHVLIDACVPPNHLVPCTHDEEAAHTRFERVLQFGRWIWEIEVDELSRAFLRGQEALYLRFFGEDLVSASIGLALQQVMKIMPRTDRAEGTWPALREQLSGLLREATFKGVEQAARLRAKEARSRPIDAPASD
ncbi:MAG: hypothetical protein HYZ53_13165 [Planctomycetes bacterium]|nr:hypothetical protein [Planctomycetota bacterium]